MRQDSRRAHSDLRQWGWGMRIDWPSLIVVIIASISALANFLWLPYQPWWSIVLITLNVFIIWAVTAHGRDIAKV